MARLTISVGEVRAEGYDTRPVSFITVKEDHM
jgi:hypothetical protein